MILVGRSTRGRRRAGAALVLALALVACARPRLARAEATAATADAEAGAPPAVVSVARGPRFAVGASFGYLRQKDLGGAIVSRFIPSLIGLAYLKVAPRLYLRPGVRLGIASLQQPDEPPDAHVEETSVRGHVEVGVLYDGWVVPALSVGTGLEARRIEFVGRGLAQDSRALDRTEWLGSLYAQAGLGVPLFHGFIVIEPYYRIHHTFSDDRSSSEVGFDVTFAL